MILVSAEEFAKTSHQKPVKEPITVNAFTESDKTRLMTSSNKWVIDVEEFMSKTPALLLPPFLDTHLLTSAMVGTI